MFWNCICMVIWFCSRMQERDIYFIDKHLVHVAVRVMENVDTFVWRCVSLCVCLFVCVYVCVCVYVYVCMYVCVCMCVCVSVLCVLMCVQMCICICFCIWRVCSQKAISPFLSNWDICDWSCWNIKKIIRKCLILLIITSKIILDM